MRDCSIQLTNHAGDLARVAQALARRGVNIKALAGMSIGDTDADDRAGAGRRSSALGG